VGNGYYSINHLHLGLSQVFQKSGVLSGSPDKAAALCYNPGFKLGFLPGAGPCRNPRKEGMEEKGTCVGNT